MTTRRPTRALINWKMAKDVPSSPRHHSANWRSAPKRKALRIFV